ncbi:helix-turn-helix domain-containing protein [Vibrio nomapromontoriensis]|uniref:helix-turn-helix domain-containing protein n=1 Tax=Vibrio nomapromontoriensis TaxID=2910246 RepID=UPI003D0A297B
MNSQPTNNIRFPMEYYTPKATGIMCELRAPVIMKEYHWHEHIEVNIIHQGNVKYEISGHSKHLSAGTVVAFWATVPHRMSEVTSDALMTIISIPVHIIYNWQLHNCFVARLLDGDIAKTHTEGLVELAECHRWYKHYNNNNLAMKDIVREEIGLFLRRVALHAQLIVTDHFEVGRPDRNISANTAKYVHQMITYISVNYHTPITVEEVADAVKLNPKYAMSIFQSMLDITIKKYLTKMRIHRAQVLLIQSQLSVSQISIESGFRSASAFYSTFQSNVGDKPLEYRKRYCTGIEMKY